MGVISQMWWNDARWGVCEMQCNVVQNVVRDVMVRCIMWPIWCDFSNMVKWNSVPREVLVRYEMCEMVRNGVT